MRILLYYLVLFSFCHFAKAQLAEDFSDGDITMTPSWKGDVDDYIVNENGMLQLSAATAGESRIFVDTDFMDSIEWNFYFKMDFSPSANNLLQVFLISDQSDFENSNMYYLEIGENGNGDALNFYKQVAGIKTLLGTGSFAALADDPAKAKVQIFYRNHGDWELRAAYGEDLILETEFEIFNEEIPFQGAYFGLNCKYSSTRKDKFFFDDIFIQEILPDLEAPEIVSLEVKNNKTLILHLSEILNVNSARNTDNFFINNGIGRPAKIVYDIMRPFEVIIDLNSHLQSGVIYTLQVSNLQDLSGNALNTVMEFFMLESAAAFDLVVNEILFDPYPGGDDFVEIYNRSLKIIKLEDIEIYNDQNNRSEFLKSPDYILPGEYIVYSPDKSNIIMQYRVENPDHLIENDLPAFNNEMGNVSIRRLMDSVYLLIDGFDYLETYHSVLIDDTEGVSLERINPDQPSNDIQNWQSAASSAGFATPTYQNSNFFMPGGNFHDRFNLPNKTFSPNGDGQDDLLILEYNLDKPGYTANIKIIDAQGRFIKDLVQNESLGTSGLIRWDGSNFENEIADVGIYIIWIELFHTDGTVIREKRPVVLADFLD